MRPSPPDPSCPPEPACDEARTAGHAGQGTGHHAAETELEPVPATVSRRPVLWPVALIVGLGLLFFCKLAAHPGWVLYGDYSDLLTYQIPQMRYLVGEWQKSGEQPLWCPYSFSGMPFVHDPQVGAFYPPHLILYNLPEAMVGPALSWLMMLHVVVAGLSMFAYARGQKLGTTGSVVAAVGYMFSGKWLLHLIVAGQYVAVGLAWLPLVMLLLERAIDRRSVRQLTLAAGALALMVLGSHPQFSFYAGLLILFWTWPLIRRGGPLDRPARRSARGDAVDLARWLGLLACFGLVTLGLIAVQLLPTLEATTQATRNASGMRTDPFTDLFFNALGLVGPPVESLPIAGWENRTGLTVLWTATALMAPAVARGRPLLRYRALVCLGLVVFGLGGAVVLQGLPGFRLFRLPLRMFLVASFPIALLVGTTVESLYDILRSDPRHGVGLLRSLLLVGVVGLVSTAFIYWQVGPPLGTAAIVYWGSLVATLPLAGWLIRRTRTAGPDPSAARRFARIWGVLLTVDLAAMSFPAVEVRDQERLYLPNSCLRFLLENKGDHDRVLDRDVVGHPGHSPLGLALAIIDRLEPVRGYNPLDVHLYKEFLRFVSDRDGAVTPENPIPNFPLVNTSLLDLLGARYLVQPSDFPRLDGESSEVPRDPRWRKVAEDPAPELRIGVAAREQRLPPFSVFENRGAFPRAFVVHRARRLPERTQVLDALKQANLRDVAFLDGLEPSAETDEAIRPGRVATAAITRYEPNRVAVTVEAERPGYLVLTDPWYPGWTCTVDGTAERLYRADYAFRGVRVPAGRHEVRFEFQPASYLWGRRISLITLAGVLALGLFSLVQAFRPAAVRRARAASVVS